MRTIVWLLVPALILVLAVSALAAPEQKNEKSSGAPESVVYDADSAFQFLQTLAGDWDRTGGHDHGDSSSLNTFRVSGAGSAIVETIFPGQESEMITVYHRNGDDLLLTHYCALHNAPVMKFQKSDKPGEIKFAFEGGTNFDPKVNMHVHEGTLRIKNADTVESTFLTYDAGKPGETVSSTLKRKQAKKN
jgi:hypothetical protein